MGLVGLSPPPTTPPTDAAPGVAAPPAPMDRLHPMLQAIASARPSSGHGGRFDADIYANDTARQAWSAHDDMPDGAILAEELFERRGPGSRALGLFVMTKQDGKWQFSIEKGSEATSNTALCVSCHREAPRDDVFFVASIMGDGAPHAASLPGDADSNSSSDSVQGLTTGSPGTHANVVDASPEARTDSEGGQ